MTGGKGKHVDEKKQKLKEEFTSARGYWSPIWDDILEATPEFFEAYMKFSSVPWKTGTLSPKVRELIYIAIDSSTTHMYEPGLKVHIRNALKYGATKAEIMEVYQLTSVLGIHTVTTGLPVLLDEMKKAGREVALPPLTPEQEQLKKASRLLEPAVGRAYSPVAGVLRGLYGFLLGAVEDRHVGPEGARADLYRDRFRHHPSV